MISCCKHTIQNKKCIRNDNKVFNLPRRFTKKKCLKSQKGFTMKSSCAPYKFCGGKNKTHNNDVILPELRKITYKNKKHKYKLKHPQSKRILAIKQGVLHESKKNR